MTDARITQASLEQWGIGSANARLTQAGVEQWATVSSATNFGTITQIALEQWVTLAVATPGAIRAIILA